MIRYEEGESSKGAQAMMGRGSTLEKIVLFLEAQLI